MTAFHQFAAKQLYQFKLLCQLLQLHVVALHTTQVKLARIGHRPQLNNMTAKSAGSPTVHLLWHGRECACVRVFACARVCAYVRMHVYVCMQVASEQHT